MGGVLEMPKMRNNVDLGWRTWNYISLLSESCRLTLGPYQCKLEAGVVGRG